MLKYTLTTTFLALLIALLCQSIPINQLENNHIEHFQTIDCQQFTTVNPISSKLLRSRSDPVPGPAEQSMKAQLTQGRSPLHRQGIPHFDDLVVCCFEFAAVCSIN